MAWNGGRTRATGELVTVSEWNNTHYNNPIWAYNQVHAGCYLTNSGNVAVGLATAITWDTETQDTAGYHSTVTNTSRITIPNGQAGYYLLHFNVSADAATAFILYYNGAAYLTFDGTHTHISRVIQVSASTNSRWELYANTAARTILAGSSFGIQQLYNGSTG